MMRAKFTCYTAHASEYQVEVNLNTVYDPEPGSENHSFWAATPAGTLQMWITNPKAFDFFTPGGEYYVDFTPTGESNEEITDPDA